MRNNIILLLLVALLAVIPLIIVNDSEFGGADGAAEEMITEIRPEYEPWFNSFWSHQVEKQKVYCLLFKLHWEQDL